MPDMGAGPRLFQKSIAAATFSFSPLSDRAALVRRIILDKVSASDTWTLTCGGQQVGSFIENTTGHQQLLSAPSGSFPSNNDLFAFCDTVLDHPLTYPIPQGLTLTIASVGGATADITVGYEEMPPGAINSSMENHPQGRQWYFPLYFSLAASVTAAGEKLFDTQGGLSFVPNLFNKTAFPQGWSAQIEALFLEGEGRNTYSGSADHQSITDHIAVVRNGQRLFTRTAGDGIPLVGTASAAGSANTVLGADFTPYPPFQDANAQNWRPIDPPLLYRPGDLYEWYVGITGDVTGGASYAADLHVALVSARESQ